MALSNAERQRLHRQRTKDKIAIAGEGKRSIASMRAAGPFSDAEFTPDAKLTILRAELLKAQGGVSYVSSKSYRTKDRPGAIARAERDVRLWQELIRDYERLVGMPDGYVTADDADD